MKRKLLSKVMLIGTLTFGSFCTLSSCSAFFGESGYTIKSVTTTTNEQTGDTVVTMVFSDEEVAPLTFIIPRGISGVDGVGIRNITTDTVTGENGKQNVKIVISYTDDKVANTEFKIPIAKDGRGIKTVKTRTDEETGDVYIQFEYTDGESSPELKIPRGADGKDGIGIDFIDASPVDPSTNTITVKIFYSDPTLDPVELTIPCGVGIKSITYDAEKSTKTEYAIKITYSDDRETNPHTDYIMLPIPQSTKWISGVGEPKAAVGDSGDFYIDLKTGDSYQKTGNEWIFMFCMKGTGSGTRYSVIFDANGGEFIETPSLANVAYRINYGEYLDLDVFPAVQRNGFTFNGWYTTKEDNPNGGRFTDLTPVLKDMTLYARWSENLK